MNLSTPVPAQRAIAVSCVFLLCACGPKIVKYEGRTLEGWIQRAGGTVAGPAHTAEAQRAEAFRVLADIGEPAVPALGRMVGSQDVNIATGAVVALRKIGPAAGPAVPQLLAGLRPGRPPRVRRAVPAALAAIDPRAEAVQLELVERLADPDNGVFRSAWSALSICFRESGPATEAVGARFEALRQAGLNTTRQEMIRNLPSAAKYGWS